jgi:hypothetical protein
MEVHAAPRTRSNSIESWPKAPSSTWDSRRSSTRESPLNLNYPSFLSTWLDWLIDWLSLCMRVCTSTSSILPTIWNNWFSFCPLFLSIPASINLLHSVVRARFLFCSSATVSEPNVEVTARPARPSHLNLQNPVRPPSPPTACTAEDGVATTAGAAEPRESAHTAPEGNNTIHSGFACSFYFVFVWSLPMAVSLRVSEMHFGSTRLARICINEN